MKSVHIIIFLGVISFSCMFGQSSDRYYCVMSSLLDQYQRPFTMLELGAMPGQLSFKIAENHDAVSVIIASDNTPELFNTCCKNHLNNVVLLNHKLSTFDLYRLGECEHFDVVVATDIQKLFGEKWQKAINSLLSLGEHMFIEVPTEDEELREYVASKGGEHVSESLYYFKVEKQCLYRRRWGYRLRAHEGQYAIESTFLEKKLTKTKFGRTVKKTVWQPGINLHTFKVLNGVYPYKALIRRHLTSLANQKHNDLRIFNVIIQGFNFVAIDCDEECRKASISVRSARAFLPSLLRHFR